MKNKKLHIWIALAVIVFFVCIAVFGCGEDIKGIRDMRFGIDIRGGVEAVFEPSGLKKKLTAEQLEMAREVIETRLDSQNILDREVTVDEKAGDVIVRFPWKSDEKNFDPEKLISSRTSRKWKSTNYLSAHSCYLQHLDRENTLHLKFYLLPLFEYLTEFCLIGLSLVLNL